MNYIDEIVEKYKKLGYIVVIQEAYEFRSVRGRFPDGWSAYSIAIEGSKPRCPSTAFHYLEDLELDLRCKYGVKSEIYAQLHHLRQQNSKAEKPVGRPIQQSLSMIGAKKLEMKFARYGLFCHIAPASRWERTRIAARRIGQHPDQVWGISVYDQRSDLWSEVDEVYLSLRNVAGALTQFIKGQEGKR
jgi:hypothetical protein